VRALEQRSAATTSNGVLITGDAMIDQKYARDILAHMGEGIVRSNFTYPIGPDGVRRQLLSVERPVAYHYARAALEALTKAGFSVVKDKAQSDEKLLP
jgi:hypothetical protein